MKTITINEVGLTDEQVDINRSKARAILTDGRKILIANYGETVLLPGGSIEEGETETQAVFRELREETGVTYDGQDLRKIMLLRHYQPKYPSIDGKILNRLVSTYFYIGRFKGISLSDTNMTEDEKNNNFNLELVDIDEVEKRIREDNSDNPRNPFFNAEMEHILCALKEIWMSEKQKREVIER